MILRLLWFLILAGVAGTGLYMVYRLFIYLLERIKK